MVGVGPKGDESVLARISVVNQFGHCVYDKFVKSKEEVTDYRTWVSGVRPEDLEHGKWFYYPRNVGDHKTTIFQIFLVIRLVYGLVLLSEAGSYAFLLPMHHYLLL